jgi:hypothetical protein
MGSPLSSIMAEIYLQHHEQIKIKHLLDDIFKIYNQLKTTPQFILNHFNKQKKITIHTK